ncbi:hypothetical protein LH20_17760 [Sphingopyxis sp. 113P3]|nr:hypothetical protein LH20_17760 [Sphingopyxis sp. 113P3]
MFGDHNIVLVKNEEDSRAIAAVVSNMRDPQEVAANASVISAAPDLLRAAESMIPTNLCLTNSNVRDDVVVPLECTMGDLRQVAAAIAKARCAA